MKSYMQPAAHHTAVQRALELGRSGDASTLPELIDLARPGCSDRIVGRESNRAWRFTHLDELWAGADVLRQMGH